VSIGDYSLFLRAYDASPRTSPSQPVVIIEAGLGGTSAEWVAAARLISQYAPVYTYDRAGYGKSKAKDSAPLPASAQPLTATKRCEDLTKLLDVGGIAPPWILVGHSYGGVLVREFLAMHGKEKVVGLVIIDSAIERTKLPDSWPALLGDASYMEVVGLEKNRVLTDEEWATLKANDQGNEQSVELEEAGMKESTDKVNKKVKGKQLLGDGRLSVIFANESVDLSKVYEWGIKNGSGTPEAREALRKRLEDMAEVDEQGQRAHLSLSSQSRFVYAEGEARTHNLQIVKPQLIADEARW
ncbi:alpha/beta-hydrolase, partial [Mollisia scopiformis]